MYAGERFNSISHLVGAGLAVAGTAVLIVLAARVGDPWKIVSFSIYGAMLVALYVFSTLYHSLRGRAKDVLRKFDHCAIYLLIAGSYTPFALVSLRGAWGWSLLGAVWTLAVLGIVQEIWLAGSLGGRETGLRRGLGARQARRRRRGVVDPHKEPVTTHCALPSPGPKGWACKGAYALLRARVKPSRLDTAPAPSLHPLASPTQARFSAAQAPKGARVLSLVIYIVMGWLALIAVWPLWLALKPAGFAWLVAGGALYTIGIVFYAADRKLRHGHGVWHLFVLGGSACHFFTVLLHVA